MAGQSQEARFSMNTCPYCHAPIPDSDDDCQPLYAQFQGKQFSDWHYAAVALLSVDAHALQHPEIHGYKNNAFHLIRLCWLLECGGDPRIGQVPRWLQAPFDGKPDVAALQPPADRGSITVADVLQASNAQEHAALVRQWAQSVWQAWRQYHDWARQSVKSMRNSDRSKT